MDLGLKGRRVLITGASRGIGRAIAASFAAEGCRLLLVARSADGLAAVQAELAARYGVEIETLALDLAQGGAVERLHQRFPQIDILVNNAGATPRGAWLPDAV